MDGTKCTPKSGNVVSEDVEKFLQGADSKETQDQLYKTCIDEVSYERGQTSQKTFIKVVPITTGNLVNFLIVNLKSVSLDAFCDLRETLIQLMEIFSTKAVPHHRSCCSSFWMFRFGQRLCL